MIGKFGSPSSQQKKPVPVVRAKSTLIDSQFQILSLDPGILHRILSCLNLIQVVRMKRVCTIWKRFIEKDLNLFERIDFDDFINPINPLDLMKVISNGINLYHFAMSEKISQSDAILYSSYPKYS